MLRVIFKAVDLEQIPLAHEGSSGEDQQHDAFGIPRFGHSGKEPDVQLCVQADAGSGSWLKPSLRPARLNTALEIMPDSSRVNTKKRRFFVGSEACLHHIFSFNQHDDGSIYISSPRFDEIVWHAVDDELGLVSKRFQPNSKLSIHGTGISHIRTRGHDAEFRYVGGLLKNQTEKSLGVRHLITAFPSLPRGETSPAGSRATDIILSKDRPSPGVFVFFAVPALGANIVGGNFRVPPEYACTSPEHQWGYFQLLSHHVLWYFYRTQFMEEWPAETQVSCLDGINVPLMIGVGPYRTGIRVRKPAVSLAENTLTINLG